MDQGRFDSLTRSLATSKTRRGLLGSLAALGAGLLGVSTADAQVTQAQCGNQMCASNPGGCNPGCVCCLYPNGNNRCRPPGTCSPGTVLCPPGQVVGSSGVCVAPTTTTTTTTTTTAAPALCAGASFAAPCGTSGQCNCLNSVPGEGMTCAIADDSCNPCDAVTGAGCQTGSVCVTDLGCGGAPHCHTACLS